MEELEGLVRRVSLTFKSGDGKPHPIHEVATSHAELVERVKHYFCHHMKFPTGAKDNEEVMPHHWDYKNKGADWTAGKGKEQSPIDISIADAVPSVTHYLKVWWNMQPFKAEVHDNGHTVLVEGAVSRLVGTDTERSNSLYEAVQFHFHTPSEHTLDGRHYPLELHIVHVITAEHFGIDEVTDEDVAPKRHLAVLGIFFEIDDTAPPCKFLNALKLDKIGTGEQIELNMFEYFGAIDRPEYFSYSGSLTTPPCSEIVNWFVVKKPFKMTSAQLKLFTSRAEFGEYGGNNRICQPVNNRVVCCGNCDFLVNYVVEEK